MLLEGVHRLVDQSRAVGEEQHAFDPAGLHQLVGQRDHGPGLAGTGGHHQEGLALLLGEGVVHGTDGPALVVALDDRRVDRGVRKRCARRTTLHHQLELVPGIEPLDLARRVACGVVPEPVLVAVGVEDHRPAPRHLLQAVGVQLRLLLADLRVLLGALRLDDGERQSVGAPEDVVHVAATVCRRHTGDRVLAVAFLGEWPARLGEQYVDEAVARLGLGVVVVVDRLLGRANGRDLPPESLDLGVLGRGQVVTLGQLLRVPLVLRAEPRGELHDLVAAQGCGRTRERGVELPAGGHGRRVRRVPVSGPDHDVEELAQRIRRRPRRDRASVVDGPVAEHPDQGELLRDAGADEVAERPARRSGRPGRRGRAGGGGRRRTHGRRAARRHVVRRSRQTADRRSDSARHGRSRPGCPATRP